MMCSCMRICLSDSSQTDEPIFYLVSSFLSYENIFSRLVISSFLVVW